MNYYFGYCLVFLCIVSALQEVLDELIDSYNDIKLDNFSCNSQVFLSNLSFILYTREYRNHGIALNEQTYKKLNPNDLTTLIIHGWLQNGKKKWVEVMKETYLNKSDANIIVLDWSYYSGINYQEAVCSVPAVGHLTGGLIYNLTKIGVNVNKVQINGFSLGAHVAGAAGQRVFNLTGAKISRINGLDAAGPSFVGTSEDQRLDYSDAVFVQAIHTNGNKNGYGPSYGTIDFQINYSMFFGCGSSQNGCPLNPDVPSDDYVLPYVFCDHIRAVAYYIESITSDQFLSVTCDSCSDFGMGLCTSRAKTIMGENCPFNESGVRYLKTNSMSPFAENNKKYKFTIF